MGSIREAVLSPKPRTGNTREREEAVLNSVCYFYFPRAPSSFIASFRPFFETGGPDLLAEWLSCHANLRKRKVPEEGVSSAERDSDEFPVSTPESMPDAGPEGIRKKASVGKSSTSAGSPLKIRPKKPLVVPENLGEVVIIADEAPSEEGQIAPPSPEVKKESKASFKKEGVVKAEARGVAKWEPAVLGTSRNPQGEGPASRPSGVASATGQLPHPSGEAGHSNPSIGSLARGVLLPKDRRPPLNGGVVRDSAGPGPSDSGFIRESAGGSLVGTVTARRSSTGSKPSGDARRFPGGSRWSSSVGTPGDGRGFW